MSGPLFSSWFSIVLQFGYFMQALICMLKECKEITFLLNQAEALAIIYGAAQWCRPKTVTRGAVL